MIGQRLGNSVENGRDHYQIKSLLGKQIGRRTFLAEDRQTGELVVVKLVLFGPDFTWDDLKLFQREAQTIQALEHPAIPKYLDSFDVETVLGRGFALVQTYIEAKSLREWVSGGHTFSEVDLRAIATHLLNILSYLHQRQPPVIHRDIKPSNILLATQDPSAENSLYLVDFGSVQTAPSSGTMTVVGTYGYMPPEQFGGRAQPASDLYSLGATLIYLITGQHPAELTQDNLQIAFTPPEHLSRSFIKWMEQLTNADLSRRTISAQKALQQLTEPVNFAPVPPGHFHQASNLPFQSAHKDLEVFSTPQELEIRFSPLRLKDSTSISSPDSFLLDLFKIVVFIVGLSIGGWFFLSIALVIWLKAFFETPKKSKLPHQKTAHLKLWALGEGALIMNLSTTTEQNGYVERVEHCPNWPVKIIKSTKLGDTVIFECAHRDRLQYKAVSISGDSEDVQWLFKMIGQWKEASVADRERKVSS